ncbi:unnamed protein product [Adineta ricciae]|uniref:G-protein coupled receptors family 1 profile domain-containing protein n=1 Tax=Adineta ricciae TaxID=249248 RepID=A0A813RYF7_ADIRI|nr:unnamed protein product [Adineta ricciae]CAF1646653.1 unnamed protein product [Adineta ricciae]
MLIVLYNIGMYGSCLNMITFLQKKLRINPCGVYLLSTSVIDFSIMNVILLMDIIVEFNPSLSTIIEGTRIWCKLGSYLNFILPCLSSTYLTLASIDRFCISSASPTLRQWSSLKISRIVVVSAFAIWALIGLHIPVIYDIIYKPMFRIYTCNVARGSRTAVLLIDGFLFSLFNGLIIPFISCIFGLLIYFNMKKSRARILPQQNTETTGIITVPAHRKRIALNRRSSHMLFMLLVQVLATFFLNIPFIVIYLLRYVDRGQKTVYETTIFLIFRYIGQWLYYLNYCKTFYINTLTSRLFRRTLCGQFCSHLNR